mgnify:CR=1 FL=1
MNGHDDESTWVEHTLVRLGESQFRAKFVLSEADRSYARDKGRHVIDRHAHEMLRARVGEAQPSNDGRQTPMRGHPVFIAQHATACCCRGCLAKWHAIPVFTAQHATATCCRGCIEKWHGIAKGRPLTDAEVNRLADLVMAWIDRDLTNHPARDAVAGARSAQADARRVKAAHAKAPRYVQPEL